MLCSVEKFRRKCIFNYLEGDSHSFSMYAKEMQQYFGYRWKTSEFIMNRIYPKKIITIRKILVAFKLSFVSRND